MRVQTSLAGNVASHDSPGPRMQDTVTGLTTPGGGTGVDAPFRFALDVVLRPEAANFQSTPIAQHYLGPDLDAWMRSEVVIATDNEGIWFSRISQRTSRGRNFGRSMY